MDVTGPCVRSFFNFASLKKKKGGLLRGGLEGVGFKSGLKGSVEGGGVEGGFEGEGGGLRRLASKGEGLRREGGLSKGGFEGEDPFISHEGLVLTKV